MLTKNDLVTQLKSLGLKNGDIVNVKVSLKSIGEIDGGAKTLLQAILDVIGDEGTLVCDSFNPVIYSFQRPFVKKNVVGRYSKSYAGAFVNTVVNDPRSYRSTHPIQAFSAIGKEAKRLTDEFTIDSPAYGFLETIAHMGAVNLRIGNKVVGVGTTHIAICKHGFEQLSLPAGVYYNDSDGKVRFFRHYWASGCNKGFNMLTPHYKNAIVGQGKIGNANALITSMESTLNTELELFEKDPTAFFCGDPGCLACSFLWKHSKYSYFTCLKTNLKRGDYKKAIYATAVKFFGQWQK